MIAALTAASAGQAAALSRPPRRINSPACSYSWPGLLRAGRQVERIKRAAIDLVIAGNWGKANCKWGWGSVGRGWQQAGGMAFGLRQRGRVRERRSRTMAFSGVLRSFRSCGNARSAGLGGSPSDTIPQPRRSAPPRAAKNRRTPDFVSCSQGGGRVGVMIVGAGKAVVRCASAEAMAGQARALLQMIN